MPAPETAPTPRPAPMLRSGFHRLQQFVREIGVLGRQVVRHPITVEHQIAGIAAKLIHAQCNALAEGSGAPHCMDPPEKSADPFPLIARTQFWPSSATARKNSVAEAVMDMEGFAFAQQRCDHRNFLCG